MPDQRLTKTRATLPLGYQFGDARPFDRLRDLFNPDGEDLRARAVWGGPCPGCATATECRSFGLNCQRYLAEHLQALAAVDPHADSNTGTPTPRVKSYVIREWCTRADFERHPGWNVIEGDEP